MPAFQPNKQTNKYANIVPSRFFNHLIDRDSGNLEFVYICSSHFHIFRDLPPYKVHHIRRAAAGEPTLLEYGRFGEWPAVIEMYSCTAVEKYSCTAVEK